MLLRIKTENKIQLFSVKLKDPPRYLRDGSYDSRYHPNSKPGRYQIPHSDCLYADRPHPLSRCAYCTAFSRKAPVLKFIQGIFCCSYSRWNNSLKGLPLNYLHTFTAMHDSTSKHMAMSNVFDSVNAAFHGLTAKPPAKSPRRAP